MNVIQPLISALLCPHRFVAVSHRGTGYKWDASRLWAIWSDPYSSLHGLLCHPWLSSVWQSTPVKGNYIIWETCKDLRWRISKKNGSSSQGPFKFLEVVQCNDPRTETYTHTPHTHLKFVAEVWNSSPAYHQLHFYVDKVRNFGHCTLIYIAFCDM